jgi:hypothetical protein
VDVDTATARFSRSKADDRCSDSPQADHHQRKHKRQDPVEKYSRRTRRKTKEDRYEYKDEPVKQHIRRHTKHAVKKKPGAMLRDEFQAPNVTVERLTLQNKGPGFSSKIKSFAITDSKGLPDLTFSNMRFLKLRREEDKTRFSKLREPKPKEDQVRTIAQRAAVFSKAQNLQDAVAAPKVSSAASYVSWSMSPPRNLSTRQARLPAMPDARQQQGPSFTSHRGSIPMSIQPHSSISNKHLEDITRNALLHDVHGHASNEAYYTLEDLKKLARDNNQFQYSLPGSHGISIDRYGNHMAVEDHDNMAHSAEHRSASILPTQHQHDEQHDSTDHYQTLLAAEHSLRKQWSRLDNANCQARCNSGVGPHKQSYSGQPRTEPADVLAIDDEGRNFEPPPHLDIQDFVAQIPILVGDEFSLTWDVENFQAISEDPGHPDATIRAPRADPIETVLAGQENNEPELVSGDDDLDDFDRYLLRQAHTSAECQDPDARARHRYDELQPEVLNCPASVLHRHYPGDVESHPAYNDADATLYQRGLEYGATMPLFEEMHQMERRHSTANSWEQPVVDFSGFSRAQIR